MKKFSVILHDGEECIIEADGFHVFTNEYGEHAYGKVPGAKPTHITFKCWDNGQDVAVLNFDYVALVRLA